VQQGVPQGEVGRFDLPLLVIQAEQGGGGIAAVVRQRGDQPVGVLDAAAVGAGHGQVRFDDPHLQAVQVRAVGAVRQVLQHRRAAGGRAAGQQHRPGRGDLAQEGAGVKGPVQQHEHARAQQGQQLAGQAGLVPAGLARSTVAPGRARVPVSARAISRSVGYPAKPCR